MSQRYQSEKFICGKCWGALLQRRFAARVQRKCLPPRKATFLSERKNLSERKVTTLNLPPLNPKSETCWAWRVDVRLPGEGNSTSLGARPVHQIISMIRWIRTSRFSIKKSLCRAPHKKASRSTLPRGGVSRKKKQRVCTEVPRS